MNWTAGQAIDASKTTAWTSVDDHFFLDTLSPAMRDVEQVIAHVAPTDFTILLIGESGVGKEAIASHIHRQSRQNQKSFTKIVCGALTPEIFEMLRRDSENDNGHGGGSRIGTLFLDEITDLAYACQASLLQILPDGGTGSIRRSLNARIISTTSRDQGFLEHAMEQGVLRRDLFYRLNGVCLRIPPLRERRDDIPGLADFLIRKYSLHLQRPQPSLSPRVLQILQEYSWPGNIRELVNMVKKVVAVGSDSAVSDLLSMVTATRPSSEIADNLSLKQAARAASRQVEKEMILKVLTQTHWNRKRAAQHLQISYKALLYKLRQIGLDESGTL